jgi:hypothetical protein
MSDYDKGWRDGVEYAMSFNPSSSKFIPMREGEVMPLPKKRKRRQSGKQKLLTQMTKKKWDKYKKTSGKKTYVQIRAMVSRSQEYKRKAKKL